MQGLLRASTKPLAGIIFPLLTWYLYTNDKTQP